MKIVMEVVGWIQANWHTVLTAVAYVIATASVIVKLTPTQKDDNIVAKIAAFLGKYIALNTSKHLGE